MNGGNLGTMPSRKERMVAVQFVYRGTEGRESERTSEANGVLHGLLDIHVGLN